MVRARTGHRGGFTLVELLVVILVIAILASMLIPVFAETRMMARSASCASNLKQFGVALALYRSQWGCFPGHEWDLGATRVRWVERVGELTDLGVKVLQCPEVPHWAGSRNNSYGYNYRYLGSTRKLSDGKYECFPVKKISHSAKTIAFADSSGTGINGAYEVVAAGQSDSAFSYAERRDRIGNHAFTLDPTHLPQPIADGHTADLYSDGASPSFIAPRHHSRANFCMVDGHVESLAPEEVYENNHYWNGYGRDDPAAPHVSSKIPGLGARYDW